MTNPDPTPPMLLPRMGRGGCWSDVVREIDLDEAERQARNSKPWSSLEQLGAVLDEQDFAEAHDSVPELVAVEDPAGTVTLDDVVEAVQKLAAAELLHRAVVIAEVIEPAPFRRGWLARTLHRRLG